MAAANLDRAREAYGIIEEHPGIQVYYLAHLLGLGRNSGAAESTLMTCEKHGMAVSENERGGLYTFGEWGLQHRDFVGPEAGVVQGRRDGRIGRKIRGG